MENQTRKPDFSFTTTVNGTIHGHIYGFSATNEIVNNIYEVTLRKGGRRGPVHIESY